MTGPISFRRLVCLIFLFLGATELLAGDMQKLVDEFEVTARAKFEEEFSRLIEENGLNNAHKGHELKVELDTRMLEQKGYFFTLSKLQIIKSAPASVTDNFIRKGFLRVSLKADTPDTDEVALHHQLKKSLFGSSKWEIQTDRQNGVKGATSGTMSAPSSESPSRKGGDIPSGHRDRATQWPFGFLSASRLFLLSAVLFILLSVICINLVSKSRLGLACDNWQKLSDLLRGKSVEEITYLLRFLTADQRLLTVAALSPKTLDGLMNFLIQVDEKLHAHLAESIKNYFNKPQKAFNSQTLRAVIKKVRSLDHIEYLDFLTRILNVSNGKTAHEVSSGIGRQYPELVTLAERKRMK